MYGLALWPQDPQGMELCIVIPTKGGRSPGNDYWLEGLLTCPPIRNIHETPIGLRIISTINEFPAALKDWVSTHCPSAELTLIEGQSSFPRKCNVGAENSSADIMIFINDDVIDLSSTFFENVREIFSRDPNLAILSPRLVFPDGRIQHDGIDFHRGFPELIGYGSTSLEANSCLERVHAVSGAVIAIRRQFFEHIGGFDERMQNAFNDIDLCFSASAAGWKVLIDRCNFAVHAEFGSRSRFERRLSDLLIFTQKWEPQLTKLGVKKAPLTLKSLVFRCFLKMAKLSNYFKYHGRSRRHAI